jgi:hypothetical protein
MALNLGPTDCGHPKWTKSTGVIPLLGMGLKAGPSGPSGTGRPKADGSSKWASVGGKSGLVAGPAGGASVGGAGPSSSAGPARFGAASSSGLAGRSGLVAGPAGGASVGGAGPSSSAGPARFEAASSSGLAGGRQIIGTSIKVHSSSFSESSAPKGSRSKQVQLSQAEGSEFVSIGGVTGRVQLSPAKETLRSCRSSPASSKRERTVAGFEPTHYRVYQRSGRRTPMPSQARESSRGPGQLPGQAMSTEKEEVTLPVSPVCLSFDGVEVDSRDSRDGASLVGELDVSRDSASIVPESEVSGDSSDSVRSGYIPVEAGELKFTLEVGEIMGLTCDGQVGQLKEVMGKLVDEKQGRGMGGERGSQVFNEL